MTLIQFLKTVSALILFLMSVQVPASTEGNHGHAGHVRHNMLLYGVEPVFASHIVYKEPHNYQLILQLGLDELARSTYLKIRNEHPEVRQFLLLDPLDLNEFASTDSLTGSLLYEELDGKRHVLLERITIPKKSYKVIYFEKLPVSLGSEGARLGASGQLHSPLIEPSLSFFGVKKIRDGYWARVQGKKQDGSSQARGDFGCEASGLKEFLLNQCQTSGLIDCEVVSIEPLYCSPSQKCQC